jgi:hypothetical protein
MGDTNPYPSTSIPAALELATRATAAELADEARVRDDTGSRRIAAVLAHAEFTGLSSRD